jgi:acetyl-CoA C-acetyltransferase
LSPAAEFQIQDIVFGCVTPTGEQGGNIAKAAAFAAGLGNETSGVTLNRFCASGLEAVRLAYANVASGMLDLVVAGGVEAMSRVPMGSDGGAWLIDPEIAKLSSFVPQGISADLIATIHGFTRGDVDGFAVLSQKRAAQAWAESRFKKSIVPVVGPSGEVILDRDEHFRPDTTLNSLAELKPSFLKMGSEFGFDTVAISKYPQVESIQHVHHAGNSSGIVDGAAAVLLGSEKAGKELGLKPRARIVSFGLTSTEPTIMLRGPAPASKIALDRAGLKIKDIDVIEINEAFAAVVLDFCRQMEISPDQVNVNGGAIALGHPLGATGAMIFGMAMDELERTQKRYGLATLCVGGGMGIASIIARV